MCKTEGKMQLNNVNKLIKTHDNGLDHRLSVLHTQRAVRGGSSFFPRGGGGFDPTTMRSIVHEPRSGKPIFLLFWTPVSDVFLASTNGMMAFFYAEAMRADFFFAILNPRKWCFPGIYTNHMMAFFYAHITCSLGSPRGGGGGLNPIVLRLSLRQSAIGTYCVGLDIMMAFFYAH